MAKAKSLRTQGYLKQRIKKIKWTSKTTGLPFSQGFAIKELIKRYGIPARRWGWYGSTIGVETKNQFLLWRDYGWKLEFLGLVNKDEKVYLKARDKVKLKELG